MTFLNGHYGRAINVEMEVEKGGSTRVGRPVAGYHLKVLAKAARIVDDSSGGAKSRFLSWAAVLLVLGKMKKA